MAATVIKAIQNKIAALTAANFPDSTIPPTFQDEATVTDGSGVQVRVPYIIISAPDTTPEYQSDRGGIENHDIEIVVYAVTAAAANQIAEALKFDGQTPATKAGLDFGTLALDNPYYHIHTARTNNPRAYEDTDQASRRVYSVTLNYSVCAGIKSTY